MKLRELSLKDKDVFGQYLGLREHKLSVYSFANIYIWKGILRVYWQIVEGCLCVFLKDSTGCFLYLPPQGELLNSRVLEDAFSIMDGFNKNQDIARVENIEEDQLGLFKKLGYSCYEKPGEYLCLRSAMADLKGDRLKHKRASVNYFIKHYRFAFEEFSSQHKEACLELYLRWMQERASRYSDLLYQGMLKDSLKCFQVFLDDFSGMESLGRVVTIDGKVQGVSFGFKISRDTFCILYEITDLSFKGISQFIFREFCRDLKGYKYINIMDDSGLENLKRLKTSYAPDRFIPAYVAIRKNEPKN